MDQKLHVITPLGISDIYLDIPFCMMVYHNKRFDYVEEAREAIQIALDLIDKYNIPPMPYLTDIRSIKHVSKEVRDYLADNELSPYMTKVGVLINSGISKIIGNIFLRFSKPSTPTKLFTNREKALEWLLPNRSFDV